MQEPSGDFVHLYDVEAHERLPDRLPYYTGEAALALVLAYRVTGERALLDRAHAALDHLTKRAWSFFGSAYFYGEEHWTCIAAHEAFPEIRDDAYLEFCLTAHAGYRILGCRRQPCGPRGSTWILRSSAA